jgi:hypothetical protein
MNEPPRSGGWWQTLPGILTAFTGIITAIAGLIVVLNQAGFFKSDNEKAARAPNEIATAPAATANPAKILPADRPRSIPQVAGSWNIEQKGESQFVGTLYLSQNGAAVSGDLIWKTLPPATIVEGEVLDSRLAFVARYKDGTEGRYEGQLDSSFNSVKGSARGQGHSVPWSATRQ